VILHVVLMRQDTTDESRIIAVENIKTVENMWVQSGLVEGRLVVLAVRKGVAPL
jgi:hypothetical protein